jgi:hypothetical protein
MLQWNSSTCLIQNIKSKCNMMDRKLINQTYTYLHSMTFILLLRLDIALLLISIFFLSKLLLSNIT